MTKAVIQGVYSDFRIVKTRKVCQAVVEFPLEKMAEFVAMFGAPDPGAEVPVVVARMALDAEKVAASQDKKSKHRLNEMPLSQQCAIKCQDVNFRRWIGACSEEDAVARIKDRIGIMSRRELDTDSRAAAAWQDIDALFYADQHGYR